MKTQIGRQMKYMNKPLVKKLCLIKFENPFNLTKTVKEI